MTESARLRNQIPGYEVQRQIAAGGMSAVYLARQQKSGRLVAVKLLTAARGLSDAEQMARFEREARLTARLRHPHIVTFLDCGHCDGRPFLVMDYVEGESLRALLTPEAPLPVERTREILAPVAKALAYLHEQNVVHRDLKPENVLIDRFGHVRVADFGIAAPAADLGELTHSGQVVGTLDYMAPEQRHRLSVDTRADQYSLAVMAYEMLTGKKPLGLFKPPSAHNDKLPSAVDQVLLRALRSEAEERYASLPEFFDALDRALAQRSAKRRPRMIVWSCAAALVSSAALLAWAIGASRSATRAPVPVAPAQQAIAAAAPRDTVAAQTGGSDERSMESLASPLGANQPLLTSAGAAQHQHQWAQRAGVAATIVNSIDMKLVLIPPGDFFMGSSEEAPSSEAAADERGAFRQERLAVETPAHRVSISRAFYLAATETTIGQFRRFISATGYQTDAETREGAFGRVRADWQAGAEFNWRQCGQLHPGDDWPVFNVSHNDATAFCRWLSEKEGRRYRLPTEAEWEYACRAGASTRFSCGDDEAQLADFAWCGASLKATMSPVGGKQSNPFGLYDMHGNLWEWCADYYAPDYYTSSWRVDPTGPAEGVHRMLRGGAFYNLPAEVRSSVRSWSAPTGRTYYIGFRAACDVEPLRQASPAAPR